MRISRVTTDGFSPITPWISGDEGVSDVAKHYRHARQTIGARLLPAFLSITKQCGLSSCSIFYDRYVRRADEDLQRYNRSTFTHYDMDEG